MVVVKVLRIIVDFVTELRVMVNPVLLLGGFARDAEHGERQAQEELSDGHGGSDAPMGQRGKGNLGARTVTGTPEQHTASSRVTSQNSDAKTGRADELIQITWAK